MASYSPFRPPIGVAPANTVVAAQQSKAIVNSDRQQQQTNQQTTPGPRKQGIVIKDPKSGNIIDLKKEVSKDIASKTATISSSSTASTTTTTTSNTASALQATKSAPEANATAAAAPTSQNPAAQSFAQKVSEASMRDTIATNKVPTSAVQDRSSVSNSNNKENVAQVKSFDTDSPNTTTTSTSTTTTGTDKKAIKDDSNSSPVTKSPPSSPAKQSVVETNKLEQEDDKTNEPVSSSPNVTEGDSSNADDSGKGSSKDGEIDDKDSNAKLTYEPGQYNPISNRNGKRVYSKEFLGAVCKMLGLEKVLDDDNSYEPFNPIQNQVDPFAPSFARGREPHRPNHNYSGRSSAGPDRPRKIIPTASYTQEVELKTVEKPWKPAMEAKSDTLAPEVAETELIKKKFRSILNKLTPNNFENLAAAVTDLKINTEEKLGDVIDIVFAKALAEPGYCVLYGQMCSHLKKITAGQANFGNTLLKRCQSQFQADIYADLNLDERKEKVEKEENPETKKQLNEELYEDMFRCRMRGLGLIKFIGELYKIGMLNNDIMFDCILRLLQDTAEESLECLCDLLATIGEKLDNSCKAEKKKPTKQSKNPYSSGQKSMASVVASNNAPKQPDPSLDYVFMQLKKLREDDSSPLSLRIKFKILDTIDLRERHRWSSKKTKDNNPKKIEEIREAHMEQLEKEKRQLTTGRRSQEGRRGMGNPSGSSGQISSMANDSGRGNSMHTSASSQALRDYSTGDYRPNHANDTVDHQKKLENLKSLRTNLNPSIGSMGLRPMVRLGPAVSAASGANATSTTTTTQSATTTNKTS